MLHQELQLLHVRLTASFFTLGGEVSNHTIRHNEKKEQKTAYFHHKTNSFYVSKNTHMKDKKEADREAVHSLLCHHKTDLGVQNFTAPCSYQIGWVIISAEG